MKNINKLIKEVKGPIAIFGAGGFIGINLLEKILNVRTDIVGFSQNPEKSWRLKAAKIPKKNIDTCNLLDNSNINFVINKYKPKTIFNLAAYGAYSKQKDIDKIYLTNFNSTYLLIETLKKYSFEVYLHAGSQSEYGLNCSGPKEQSELIPNSHYAVSKAATHYLLKYYGKIEKLPVIHLRLYSVYGHWEEPNRLIPTLIAKAKLKHLPDFVDPDISRDFVYVDDVLKAFLQMATYANTNLYGDAFNIATGKKTTIRELALLTAEIFKIKEKPNFGTMANKNWDLKDWVGDSLKIQEAIGWKAETDLKKGLIKTYGFTK